MQQTRHGRLLLKSIPWTIIDGVFCLLYAVGMVVLLGRLIRPEEFGLAGIALGLTQLTEAAYSTGLQEAVIRAKSGHTRLTDTAHTLVMGFSLAGAALCCLLAWPLARVYGQDALPGLVAAASLSLPLNALFAIPAARLGRKIRTKTLTSRMLLSKLFSALAFAGCALAGLGAWSVVLSVLAASLGSLALILWQTNRLPRLRWDGQEARGLVRFGLLSSGDFFFWMASSRVFALLFGYFHGMQALGFFQFAQRLVDELATLLQVTILRVGLPYFAGLNRSGADLRGAFLTGTRVLNALAAPVFAGLILVAPVLLPLVFGPRWDPATPMIALLSGMWILLFGRVLIPVLIKAQGWPEYNLKFSLLTALGNLVAVLATAGASPLMATAALAASQLAVLPVQYRVIQSRFGIPLAELARGTAPALLAAAGMAAAVWAVRTAAAGVDAAALLALLVATGMTAYLLLITLLDRELLVLAAGLVRRGRAGG